MKTFAVALSALALALAGCGGDDEDSADTGASGEGSAQTEPQPTPTQEGSGGSGSAGGGATTNLKIDADPGGALAFTEDSLTAKAGEVTIEMGNPSSLPHAVAIEGNGVDESGETVEKDGTSTVTAELEAGTYEFYCPVGGHREGGMVGELTVE
jgi:plastocyanin